MALFIYSLVYYLLICIGVDATPIPGKRKGGNASVSPPKSSMKNIASHPIQIDPSDLIDLDDFPLASLEKVIEFAKKHGYVFPEETIPVEKIKNPSIAQRFKTAVKCANTGVRVVRIGMNVLQELNKNPQLTAEIREIIQRMTNDVEKMKKANNGYEKAFHGLEVGKSALCLVQSGLKYQMGKV